MPSVEPSELTRPRHVYACQSQQVRIAMHKMSESWTEQNKRCVNETGCWLSFLIAYETNLTVLIFRIDVHFTLHVVVITPVIEH